MMLKIKHWLTSPTFPGDEEKTIRAHVIHVTLLSAMGFLVIAMIGNWLGGRIPATVTGIDTTTVILCLLFYYWTHQGKVGLASIGLVMLGIISITLAVASLGTIRIPTTATYLLLVIVAGLLFDLGGIIVMTLLSSLAILGLIVAENAGLLPPPDLTVTLTQWITYTALFGSCGGLTIMVLRSMRQALRRAQSEIAEREREELSLKQALAWKEAIFEGSRDAIFITDVDSRLTAVNAAACQLTGYSREELLTMRIPDLHEEVDLKAYRTYHDQILTGEEILSEAKILRKDGGKVDVEFNNRRIVIEGVPLMNAHHRPRYHRAQARGRGVARERGNIQPVHATQPHLCFLQG